MGSFLHRFSRAFPSFSSSALFSLRTSITSISNVSSVHEKTDRNCILSLIIYIEVKLLITYCTKRVKMQREKERSENTATAFFIFYSHYSKYRSNDGGIVIVSQRSKFVLTHFPPVAKLCINEAC